MLPTYVFRAYVNSLLCSYISSVPSEAHESGRWSLVNVADNAMVKWLNDMKEKLQDRSWGLVLSKGKNLVVSCGTCWSHDASHYVVLNKAHSCVFFVCYVV